MLTKVETAITAHQIADAMCALRTYGADADTRARALRCAPAAINAAYRTMVVLNDAEQAEFFAARAGA